MRLAIVAVLAAGLAVSAQAHDPRSVAREFSSALQVEGAGSVELRYKSLHWNEGAYQGLMANPERRDRMNAGIWNKLGSAELAFDIVVGDQTLAKGSYGFGLNIDGEDRFSLALTSGETVVKLPLEMSRGELTEYVGFSIVPTAAVDTFAIVGRGGLFVGSALVKVPHLAEHAEGEAPQH